MNTLSVDILRKVIRKRPAISHKGTFGRVVLIGGNKQYGGVIMMSAQAAVYSGAGLVTVVTESKNHVPLHTRLPEAMVIDRDDHEGSWLTTNYSYLHRTLLYRFPIHSVFLYIEVFNHFSKQSACSYFAFASVICFFEKSKYFPSSLSMSSFFKNF